MWLPLADICDFDEFMHTFFVFAHIPFLIIHVLNLEMRFIGEINYLNFKFLGLSSVC